MANIYGTWKHEMASGESSVTTRQMIHEDGSYETHMIYVLENGCRQDIHHYGEVEIGGATLRLSLESGQTQMTRCTDSTNNFEVRDFTDEELEEARGILDQEIQYHVVGDTLKTVVRGPEGEVEVAYIRE